MSHRVGLRLRLLLAVVVAFAAAACAGPMATAPLSGEDPLVVRPADPAPTRRLVLFMPGVLNSVEIFSPTEAWRADGDGLVLHRLPGMDGLALDHRIEVDAAADRLAAAAASFPDAEIGLVGYSAGAPIVLAAAERLRARAPRVVLINATLGFPQTTLAPLRSAADVLRIAVRERTFDADAVWRAYYPVLLFGRDGGADPARADDIERIRADRRAEITTPSVALLSAHAGDIAWRRVRPTPALEGVEILFLHGEDDPVVSPRSAEAYAARAPDAHFVGFEGQGHLLFLTEPRLWDVARAFFDGGAPAARRALADGAASGLGG